MDCTARVSPDQRAQLLQRLQQRMSPWRFEHSLRVEALAVDLARFWGVSEQKASIAGLLHDTARDLPDNRLTAIVAASDDPLLADWKQSTAPVVLHAPVGALIARQDFGVTDSEILTAIALHTTGAAEMGPLAMIIFLADYCEPGRHFPGVEPVRSLLRTSLEAATLQALAQTIEYLRERDLPVDAHTLEAEAAFAARCRRPRQP